MATVVELTACGIIPDCPPLLVASEPQAVEQRKACERDSEELRAALAQEREAAAAAAATATAALAAATSARNDSKSAPGRKVPPSSGTTDGAGVE